MVLNEFELKFVDKYCAGQKEHGGNMWQKPGMLYCLLEEVTDLVAYIYTLKWQLKTSNPDLHDFLMSPGEDDE